MSCTWHWMGIHAFFCCLDEKCNSLVSVKPETEDINPPFHFVLTNIYSQNRAGCWSPSQQPQQGLFYRWFWIVVFPPFKQGEKDKWSVKSKTLRCAHSCAVRYRLSRILEMFTVEQRRRENISHLINEVLWIFSASHCLCSLPFRSK